MRTLAGKRVLITGAARGIGRALAQRFAHESSHVLASDLDAASLEQTLRAVGEAGGSGTGFTLDVTSEASIDAARDAIHAEGGAIDVLVNNAGIIVGGAFLDVPLSRHRQQVDINLLGVMRVSHAFLPDLISRPQGHLVNIASASGLLGLPWGSSYATSKWAVIGLSESLRLEMRELGHGHVAVTTVCPSYADTGMFAGSRAPAFTPLLSPEVLADRIVRAVLADRPFVRTPFMVKTVPPLRALLPTPLFDWIARKLGATTSMRGWHGRSAAQGSETDPR